MPSIRVLFVRGEERIDWRPEEAIGQPSGDSLARAESVFWRERRLGSAVFAVRQGQPAQRAEHFDPSADEIIVIPRRERLTGMLDDRGQYLG